MSEEAQTPEPPFERIVPNKLTPRSQEQLANECVIAVALDVNPTWDNVRALCAEYMRLKERRK